MTPVVIAGGGLAGGAAACLLAKAGRPVILVERERHAAHKVCGEFLSGEALADLVILGLDTAALGAAPITRMRLVHRGRVAEAALPFPAAGLSRFRLDEALLHRAAALGAGIQRGIRVRTIDGRTVSTDSGPLDAAAILLATGKHELRDHPRLTRPPEPLIGFKTHLRLGPAQTAALAGHVDVILFRGGYAGLQLIEDGIANLCLLTHRARYDAAGQDWATLLDTLCGEESHLARRLGSAVPCWPRPMTIFRVPYGFIHDGNDSATLYRLGDQAAVIPSFCGDGMAIALHSAKLAAHAVLAGQPAAAYHRAMRRDAGPPVRLAFNLYRATRAPALRTAIVRAAQAWPGLLATAARHTRVASPGAPSRNPIPNHLL